MSDVIEYNFSKFELAPEEGEAYQDVKPEVVAEPEEIKESPKPPKVLSTRAYVKDQATTHPHTVSLGRAEVRVLDLSKEDDIATYSEIKTTSLDPDMGLTITNEDIKYSEKSNNWLVLLELQYFNFSPIF